MLVIFSSTRDELAEATVPCEYCYVQVNIYELERHTVEK